MIEPSNNIELTKLYEYCMRNVRRIDEPMDYKLLKKWMFGSFESTLDSRSNNGCIFSCSFSRNLEFSMVSSSFKCSGVGDFKTCYTSEKRMTAFWKCPNLSRTCDERRLSQSLASKRNVPT